MIWRLEHHCYHRQWHLLLLRLLLRHPKKVREVVSQKKKKKKKMNFLLIRCFLQIGEQQKWKQQKRGHPDSDMAASMIHEESRPSFSCSSTWNCNWW